MTHAYFGKPLRHRSSGVSLSIGTLCAYAAYSAAFVFSAAIVLGLVG